MTNEPQMQPSDDKLIKQMLKETEDEWWRGAGMAVLQGVLREDVQALEAENEKLLRINRGHSQVMCAMGVWIIVQTAIIVSMLWWRL